MRLRRGDVCSGAQRASTKRGMVPLDSSAKTVGAEEDRIMKSFAIALAALLAIATGCVLPAGHAHAETQIAWCSCG